MRKAASGKSATEICRKIGVSEPTLWARKKNYAGLDVAEIRRLRQLEDENRRLKPLVAEMGTAYQVSERRACLTLQFPRSSQRYQCVADPQNGLRLRLRDLVGSRIGYEYRRSHVLHQREGWQVNQKRMYRLFHEEGLAMRRKPPRRRIAYMKREILRRQRGRTNAGLWTLCQISSLMDEGCGYW